jgi:hypothetical protein
MRILRSWLAAVLCATLLVAPASAQNTASPAIAGAAPDTSSLRAIEAQVAQIRGLQPLSEPELKLLDPSSLNAYLTDAFERDYLPSEREADQKELVMLGLIKPTDDLVQIELNLLNSQVVGVYDPDAKSMFVLANDGGFGPGERITYAHEFNHALQDQYFNLDSIAPKHPDSNDRSLAVHSVVEGDAVLLQTLWAQANITQDELMQLARAGGSDDGLGRVPLVVRAELLFPYVEGFNFVRQVFRQGNGYAAVDDVLRNPPESTSQVLHPDKYRDQVHPVEVQLPDLATTLGSDWRRVGGGVLGELDTRVLLEQWGTDHTEAVRVAAGWSGDRWQVVDRDGRSAIVVKSTWETPAAARDFFSSYARGLRTRFDAATVDESSATRQALTTPVAATDLQLHGNDVLAVIAFDRESANAIVGAVSASSPG